MLEKKERYGQPTEIEHREGGSVLREEVLNRATDKKKKRALTGGNKGARTQENGESKKRRDRTPMTRPLSQLLSKDFGKNCAESALKRG